MLYAIKAANPCFVPALISAAWREASSDRLCFVECSDRILCARRGSIRQPMSDLDLAVSHARCYRETSSTLDATLRVPHRTVAAGRQVAMPRSADAGPESSVDQPRLCPEHGCCVIRVHALRAVRGLRS